MTPLKDYYNKKIEKLERTKVLKNIAKLEIGDFVYIKGIPGKTSSITGFVKKIARVDVILESAYGGWADNDIILQELKVKKSEITKFVKPC